MISAIAVASIKPDPTAMKWARNVRLHARAATIAAPSRLASPARVPSRRLMARADINKGFANNKVQHLTCQGDLGTRRHERPEFMDSVPGPSGPFFSRDSARGRLQSAAW